MEKEQTTSEKIKPTIEETKENNRKIKEILEHIKRNFPISLQKTN